MSKKKKSKARTAKKLKPRKAKAARRQSQPIKIKTVGVSDKALKEQIRDLIVQGRKAFDGGDYDRALPLLKRVNEMDGNFPDVLNMLGLIYHAKGQFSKALEAFEEALTINPKYTEASLNLAVTCNDLGRFQEARFVYARAKKAAKPSGELDPYVRGRLANMHAEVGDVYQTLGRPMEASLEYRKALSLRPTFVDIQTKLGVALREIGNKIESLEILAAAVKNDGRYLPASINLGLTYFSMGKHHEAVKTWHDVLKKDPQNEKARMYLRLVKDG